MKNGKLLDLYSDYLISAFGQTTATGLSSLLDGEVSHDQMQRSLAGAEQTSADLWRIAKPHVRQIESDEGVMIVDDSIAEKPCTDENDIVCWHYDHSQQRTIKGINFVTCLYHSQGVSLPVGFELVRKTERYTDPQDGEGKASLGQNQERNVPRPLATSGAECGRQAAGTLSTSGHAGTGTDETCHSVFGRCGVCALSHPTSLHKRRWFNRHPISGHQRYHTSLYL